MPVPVRLPINTLPFLIVRPQATFRETEFGSGLRMAGWLGWLGDHQSTHATSQTEDNAEANVLVQGPGSLRSICDIRRSKGCEQSAQSPKWTGQETRGKRNDQCRHSWTMTYLCD